MGIWRNIGKIVILSFQIVYEEMKWHIASWRRVKRVSPKKEVNNKVFDSLSKLKKRDIIERYKQEEQESLERVEWSENPYYES